MAQAPNQVLERTDSADCVTAAFALAFRLGGRSVWVVRRRHRMHVAVTALFLLASSGVAVASDRLPVLTPTAVEGHFPSSATSLDLRTGSDQRDGWLAFMACVDAERDLRAGTAAFYYFSGCLGDLFPGVPAAHQRHMRRFSGRSAGSFVDGFLVVPPEYARLYNEFLFDHALLFPDA